MKNCIIFLTLLCICSCIPQKTVKKEEPLPPKPLTKVPAQITDESVLLSKEVLKPLYGTLLSNVKVSKTSFNPGQREEITISFKLAKQAKISIQVYDPDWVLIKTLVAEKDTDKGEQKVSWDGKDMDREIVPYEAYFFTITAEDEAGVKEIYDPTTFSGGEWHDITTANTDPVSGTINYNLPDMGRVLIRIGVEGGPLLNTVVDWEPRIKGAVTEYWTGKDKDNLIDLYNNPKFKMLITYFSLPENSVIAFGNKALSFKDYKKSLMAGRPLKTERTSSVSKVSPHYRLLRTVDYSPNLKMALSNIQRTESDGTVILKGKTLVKVDLDEQDKVIFQNQQFEIVFFLDNEFYAEDETGYTPFNWVWDLSNVKEGEHVVTVNLSGFKDQIGVISRKVKVVK